MIILIALLVIGGGTASISLAIDSWLEDSNTSSTNQSAYQIATAVQTAATQMNSFQFDVQMDMSEGMMVYSIHSAIDETNGKMSMDFHMTTLTPEPLTVQGEMYVIEDCAYVNLEMPSEIGSWSKFCAPGLLQQQAIISPEVDFLSQFVDVEVLGTEMVDGVECYKLRVTPDMSKLWAWALGQPGMEGLPADLQEIEDLMEDLISDFSIIEWIAKDTYFPMKFVIAMTFTTEDGPIDITMTGFLHHINEPMSIELPPEAADAVEIPSY
ncbi:DUF6612 family protein [Chloroflexota bacterium]